MSVTAEYRYDLFADYFQFYLQDEQAGGGPAEDWTPEAVQNLLVLADGLIAVGTVRNMTVPVTVLICTEPPEESFDAWDRVNECDIAIPSGRLVVAGCTDYFPDAARIILIPGNYRARIFYGNLDTLSEDGLEGEDHYQIALWPTSAASPPHRLKIPEN